MKDCKNKILKQILYQPKTMGDLIIDTTCASETVDKYVKELEKAGKISHRKSKFKIFFNPNLELEKIEFFELMLNGSVRSVILLLLKTNKISQLELEVILNKSCPTISRTLKLLINRNIIESHYLAPGIKYSLKDKPKIISWMHETHPKIISKMVDGIVEMFAQ